VTCSMRNTGAPGGQPSMSRRSRNGHGRRYTEVNRMKGSIAAVLVVEDDPLLLELAVEVVHEAGLEPITATTADEALAILKARADDVRLVFTDIQMPGSMDGLRLAHAVRKGWPPVALVVTSGHCQIGTKDLPEGGRFVAKPYDAATLSRVFREMVGAGADHHPAREPVRPT